MRCPRCGNDALYFLARRCGACGSDLSPNIHLFGVLGGVIGSLLGFTFYNVAGALVGGLVGILLYVYGRMIYRWATNA